MHPLPSTAQASSDERVLAALGHVTILFLGFGVFGPALLWTTQRKKSSFVAFHALQALAYQLLVVVFGTLWTCGITVLIIVLSTGMVAFANVEEANPGVIFLLQFVLIGLFLGFYALYMGGGFLGAILTLAGRDFRYPLLGRWIENYLRADPAVEAVPPQGAS